MARPKISEEQKKAEGAKLKRYFAECQNREGFTQEDFVSEMGVTQGLLGQWFSGKTAIPDKRLLWLANRLGFDPVEFRPSVLWATSLAGKSGSSRLSELISRIPPEAEDYIANILDPIVERLEEK